MATRKGGVCKIDMEQEHADHVTYREMQELLDRHADRVTEQIGKVSTHIDQQFEKGEGRFKMVEDRVLTIEINEKNRSSRDAQKTTILSLVVSAIIGLIGLFWKNNQ